MWVQQKCIKAARYSPTEFVIDSHEYVIDDIIDGLQTWGRYVQVYSVHSGQENITWHWLVVVDNWLNCNLHTTASQARPWYFIVHGGATSWNIFVQIMPIIYVFLH